MVPSLSELIPGVPQQLVVAQGVALNTMVKAHTLIGFGAVPARHLKIISLACNVN
jgi:hypothetical protein